MDGKEINHFQKEIVEAMFSHFEWLIYLGVYKLYMIYWITSVNWSVLHEKKLKLIECFIDWTTHFKNKIN